jgi:NAD-dependent dihydropyrimidine dehydrogenase PreA subunit
MPFVIVEPCIDVMDQACLRVCPVACIHGDAGQDRKLSIDPEECIDCGACEPTCPVEAIYDEFALPAYSGRKLPLIPVQPCHPCLGWWSNTRRRLNPRGMLLLFYVYAGGADASAEVIDASSQRSLTSQMGLWSQ